MGVIEVGAEGGLACTVDEVPAILPETAIAIVFTSKNFKLLTGFIIVFTPITFFASNRFRRLTGLVIVLAGTAFFSIRLIVLVLVLAFDTI